MCGLCAILQVLLSEVVYSSISKLNQLMFGNYQLVSTTRCQVHQIFSYGIIIVPIAIL